ncbi:universal stress protein [Streptomyces sp. BR123]|uniref:universal stress protein n=1 Tax=Streptomyces sp. BR123 TaxID=2749828 RepID=UPI0015C48EFE|nr:universal stress protein [Streptomyces sp. BR123]NXY95901.1 universal stress protein [Streptomyces sp. BR123]
MSSRSVIAGVDGSAESLAAAAWAAREARRLALPLRILHARQEGTPAFVHSAFRSAGTAPAGTALTRWSGGRVRREITDRLRQADPALDVTVEEALGHPARVLLSAAGQAEVLVLGSRGLGAVGGFLSGSVSLPVIAHAERPVVVVPAGERSGGGPRRGAGAECPPARGTDVVLGLDLARPCDELLAYAFDAAAMRKAILRVIHGRSAAAADGQGPAALRPRGGVARAGGDTPSLADALRPWRGTHPGVRVVGQCVVGRPAAHLAEASKDASLLIVGRRVRQAALGPHIGPVAHAVLRNSAAPVAVVPHP